MLSAWAVPVVSAVEMVNAATANAPLTRTSFSALVTVLRNANRMSICAVLPRPFDTRTACEVCAFSQRGHLVLRGRDFTRYRRDGSSLSGRDWLKRAVVLMRRCRVAGANEYVAGHI